MNILLTMNFSARFNYLKLFKIVKTVANIKIARWLTLPYWHHHMLSCFLLVYWWHFTFPPYIQYFLIRTFHKVQSKTKLQNEHGCVIYSNITFNCLFITFNCLFITFNCLFITFNCLSITFDCLFITFNWGFYHF